MTLATDALWQQQQPAVLPSEALKKRSGHTKGGKRIERFELEVVTIQCQSLFPHQAEAGAVVFGCMCWCTKDQRKQSMSPRRDN